MKSATAKVICHKTGQLSIQFNGITEEGVIRAIDKHGDTIFLDIENKHGVRFSARNAHLSICTKLSNSVLLRPLVSDGKFIQTHDKYNTHQAECVKLAVKEFITVYNSTNNDKTAIFKPAVLSPFSVAQEHALSGVAKAFNLKPVHENQIRELLNGWDLKQKFEDGVYYVHASGKYRYLAAKQPNGEVWIFNINKGLTKSSLNNDPHHALTAGIVKKEVPF